ncbi:MAG: small acid-soluble spore protein SspI [Bacilli bacterium]|nr:small acid-soluble spore protein SspI [Bacilli bacterium]
MNISIRNHIIDNFKDCDLNDIKNSINQSINDKDEITLPGLGVFFEILWVNSSSSDREKVIKTIADNIKSA